MRIKINKRYDKKHAVLGAKEYNISTEVFTKEELDKKKETEDIVIEDGYIQSRRYLQPSNTGSENESFIVKLKADEGIDIPFNVTKKRHKFYKNVGYVKTIDDTYIMYTKPKWYLLLIPILAIIVILMALLSHNPEKTHDLLPIQDITINDIDNHTKPSEVDNNQFSIDCYMENDISEEYPYLGLINPDENDVYFKFTVYEANTDNELFSTDLIEPGMTYPWDCYQILKEKNIEYLDYVIDVYSMDENQTHYHSDPIKGVHVNFK